MELRFALKHQYQRYFWIVIFVLFPFCTGEDRGVGSESGVITIVNSTPVGSDNSSLSPGLPVNFELNNCQTSPGKNECKDIDGRNIPIQFIYPKDTPFPTIGLLSAP